MEVLLEDLEVLLDDPNSFLRDRVAPVPESRRKPGGKRMPTPQHREKVKICLFTKPTQVLQLYRFCRYTATVMVTSKATKRDRILQLAKQRGALRNADFEAIGVSRQYIADLVEKGDLERIGRGLFSLPYQERSEHHALVEVAVCAPRAVICLTSALQFHGLTTQLPPFVWIALPRTSWTPVVPTVGVEVVHMSLSGLSQGVEHHKIEGVQVPIFSAAKTVADCFKYRSRVGTSVAIEALQDCLRQQKATRTEIIKHAKNMHVWSVLRPYMEVINGA